MSETGLHRPRVVFLGYYGAGNLGDEAILGVTLRELRTRFPGIEAIVPGHDPHALTATYRVNSFSWQDLSALITSIRNADLVVVGGGGLLHDYWPPRPETMLTPAHFGLTYYCGLGWLAGQLGKPVFLYAAGAGPLLHRESRDLVRSLAQIASGITVRDAESKKILEDLGLPSGAIEVTADPAWLVQPEKPEHVGRVLANAGVSTEKWMAVTLRNWDVGVRQEQWEHAVLVAVRELAERHGMGVLFVPFQHLQTKLQDDRGVAERLARQLSGIPAGVIREPCSPGLALALAARSSLVVGMRFHSVLFGAAGGTPTVALAYDPKVTHLAGELGGAVETIDLHAIRPEAIIGAAEAVLSRRSEIEAASPQFVHEHRELARRNLERLEQLLRHPPLLVPSPTAGQIASDVIETERLASAARTSSLFVMKVYEDSINDTAREDSRMPTGTAETRTVRIVTPSFYDPAGSTVYAGGAERYVLDLVSLIHEFGWDATIVQPAAADGWEREFRGVRVQGVGRLEDRFSLGAAVERRLPPVPLTIFHAFYLAGEAECSSPAIGISHGIYWDDPFWAADPGTHRRQRERALEAVRRLDLVVSVDENTINWVRSESPELAGRMVRIPNFVDLEQFRCDPESVPDHPVILYPRRLSSARGYWLLARIAPALLERSPNLELHLVGDADTREAEHAKRLGERYGERVTWQTLPPEKMHEAYQRASIVVIPTVAAEGTSLSLLEAQACGRAVVTTAVGGLTDLVIDGFNAVVVPPTPSALLAAVEQLLSDPPRARELGTRAQTTARQFSKQRWRERWIRVLKSYLVSPKEEKSGGRQRQAYPLEERKK